MRLVTITIETENAAFDNMNRELARILRDLAEKIKTDDYYDGKKIMDINGNSVGKVELS